AAEEVVGGTVRLAGVEQPQHRLGRLAGALERVATLPERGVHGDGVRRADRAQLAAAGVQHEADARERLEPPAEARAHAPGALGDRPEPPAVLAVEVQDAIGLAVTDRAQDDRFGLERRGHPYNLPPMADGRAVTLYTTEPCGFCR